MDAKKIAEGDECVKKAEKYLKTSLMKWKPDYDSAAAEYDRAAICYKNAKQLDKCLDAYLKASDCHEQNGILFHAARCKAQAALVCKDMKRMDDAKNYMETAARLYAETGTPDTAAMAMDKAAKFLEPIDPAKALEIYQKALSIVEDHSDKTRMIAEFMSRISKIHLKLEQYDKAAASIAREVDTYVGVQEYAKVGKLTTGLVLVHLIRGDSIAAQKAYQRAFAATNFATTEDAQLLPAMIDSFEKNEADRFQRFINHPHMKNLDNEYVRLMKKIKIEDSGASATGTGGGNQGGGASAAASGGAHEEEEEGGGLL